MEKRNEDIPADGSLTSSMLVNMGLQKYRAGQYRQAVPYYEQAISQDPDNLDAHRNLGATLQDLGLSGNAIACYKRALAIDPDSAPTYNNLGISYASQGMLQQAFDAYYKAIELDPDFLLTYHNLAILCEQCNRIDEAAELAVKGMDLMPGNPLFKLIFARCERRKGRHQQVVGQLEAWLQTDLPLSYRAKFNFELGKDYDSLGRYDKAYQCFEQANDLCSRYIGDRRDEGKSFLKDIDALFQQFNESWHRSWLDIDYSSDGRDPIFLVGFPRSGTTLLEQILDSHPSLQSIEEKPLVNTLVATLKSHYPAMLGRLDAPSMQKLRNLYHERASRMIDIRPDTRIVDKLPLNILHIGLIHRIFPQARFIFAMRHPCDVCLSCFMQDFEWNPSMDSFLDMQTTVQMYDKVMKLWHRYAQILPIQYHQVRYEDLVDDTETEVRKLLAFLDLEWDDRVMRYTDHASNRGVIRTPSYYEVTQPVYRKARYRWLNYAKHLREQMTMLMPHITHFGYCEVGKEYLPVVSSPHKNTSKQMNQAVQLIGQSRYKESIAILEQVITSESAPFQAYCYLGGAYQALNRMDESITSYLRAIELCPDSAEAHSDLSICYAMTNRYDEAVAYCEKAIALNPGLWPAYRNLALLYEQCNRIAEAKDVATRGLAIRPDDGPLNYMFARCDRYDGKHDSAVQRLTRCINSGVDIPVESKCHYELGQNYNAMGDYESAFKAFTKANKLAGQVVGAKAAERMEYLRKLDELYEQFNPEWIRQWNGTAPDMNEPELVFLVGFPRSGTTLLDQILDAHPRIQTVEEKPLMESVFYELRPDYPACLSGLDRSRLDQLQKVYLSSLDKHLNYRKGCLVIDKFPLNITHVGTIHRLWPNARFILAMRHPCDVCLSCFMQDFKSNPSMNHFFDINDAARLYDRVMRLWRRYQELLPLQVHTVKYEHLVEDLEGQSQKLLAFLGIGWDTSILNYADHAKARGMINTPSHYMVTQPVNKKAAYRWHHYERHLMDIKDILQPHIDSFGY